MEFLPDGERMTVAPAFWSARDWFVQGSLDAQEWWSENPECTDPDYEEACWELFIDLAANFGGFCFEDGPRESEWKEPHYPGSLRHTTQYAQYRSGWIEGIEAVREALSHPRPTDDRYM